ncbi:hypothetical protein FF38_01627 [Lucilia cuprina]|uniref:Uncharacterized protein n=1 Tax=Lucilia cuprina TaxID=7375 RepID=A0A0L0BRF2_LUCCU|nr:hypothetical protein FF38_01627 [Lucilia cuprina]
MSSKPKKSKHSTSTDIHIIKNCEVLAEHSVCLKSIVFSFWNTPKYIKQFPIKSEEELLKWEDGINEENKDKIFFK